MSETKTNQAPAEVETAETILRDICATTGTDRDAQCYRGMAFLNKKKAAEGSHGVSAPLAKT